MKDTGKRVYVVEAYSGEEVVMSWVMENEKDANKYVALHNRGKLSFDTPDDYEEYRTSFGSLTYKVRERTVFEFDPMDFVETGRYTKEQCEQILDTRMDAEYMDEVVDYEDELNNINVFAAYPSRGNYNLDRDQLDSAIEDVCTNLCIPKEDSKKVENIIINFYDKHCEMMEEDDLKSFILNIINRETILSDLEKLRALSF